jgi:hypothetical protein
MYTIYLGYQISGALPSTLLLFILLHKAERKHLLLAGSLLFAAF